MQHPKMVINRRQAIVGRKRVAVRTGAPIFHSSSDYSSIWMILKESGPSADNGSESEPMDGTTIAETETHIVVCGPPFVHLVIAAA